tara:strand:- start:765 stop:1421 length:657 start_codon:yes stop_codon:yes gene_type:complete
MGDSLDSMFGGDESGAQRKENSDNRGYFDDKANEGRDDALQLFPASDENRNMGYQAALDLLKISMPEQSRQLRRGNVAAQNLVKASMPQYQNAILGNRVDYRQLQPTLLSDNSTYRSQNVPDFIKTGDLPLRNQPNYAPGENIYAGAEKDEFDKYDNRGIRREGEEVYNRYRLTEAQKAQIDNGMFNGVGSGSPITDDITIEEKLANLPRSTSRMGRR